MDQLKNVLGSMITKSPENTSGMETSCCIRGLIRQVKIGNFGNIVIKE